MKVREALNLTGWILLPVYGGFMVWLTWMLVSHYC